MLQIGYLSTAQPVKKAAQNTSGQSGAAVSGNSDSAVSGTEVGLSANYKYAEFSKINSGKAILYKGVPPLPERIRRSASMRATDKEEEADVKIAVPSGRNAQGDWRNHRRRSDYGGCGFRRNDVCRRYRGEQSDASDGEDFEGPSAGGRVRCPDDT